MGFRIGIVGAGAIGMYYGGKLAHAGSDVHLLMRDDLSEIRRDGIFVRGEGENFRVSKINCSNSTKEIGPCDVVIVAVKATSNSELVDLLPPLLHDKTMLLTLQNGLGNEEFLAEHFGVERVLGGLCFIAVHRHSQTEVERYAYGQVIVGEFRGPPQPRTREIAAEFNRASVRCTVTDDLARERWRKLIWNIPFNGLSIVAGGIDNRANVGAEKMRKLAREIMYEDIARAHQSGQAPPSGARREHK